MSAIRVRIGTGFTSWRIFPTELDAEQAPKVGNATAEVILRGETVKQMAKAVRQADTRKRWE